MGGTDRWPGPHPHGAYILESSEKAFGSLTWTCIPALCGYASTSHYFLNAWRGAPFCISMKELSHLSASGCQILISCLTHPSELRHPVVSLTWVSTCLSHRHLPCNVAGQNSWLPLTPSCPFTSLLVLISGDDITSN